MEKEQLLWVEKYRPRKVEDCILPTRIKRFFNDMVKKGEMQNLMLIGPAGCGKTTSALALADQLKLDAILINCSEEGNIDTVRTTIRDFAGKVSLGEGGKKLVIMDEFDGSSAQMQAALRAFIEEFAANCRFIFTANYPSKVIEPIRSRTTTIDYALSKEEKLKVIQQFDKRLVEILKQENIRFEAEALQQVVIQYFPDFRRVLGELQANTTSGELTKDTLTAFTMNDVEMLYGFLKGKEFTEMRKWVAQHPEMDFQLLWRNLLAKMEEKVSPKSFPQFILHGNRYQLQDVTVPDRETNLVCFLLELMVDCEFV